MIINARVWQRSNRIIQISHGLGTALRKGGSIRITEMSDLKGDYLCELGRPVDLRPSVFWRLERKLHSLMQRVLRHKFSIPGVVTDWSYRDYEGVEKYHEQIVRFFTPRTEKIGYALNFEREHLSGDVVKVGVHIRRGDYKEWHDGKYYFDDEVYARNMRALAQELPGEKLFILFSNEPVNLSHFTIEGAQVVVSKGSPLDDHYLISKCDYLMGPPSTFSRWGAYMGKKPIAFIEDKGQTLELSDFKYISI